MKKKEEVEGLEDLESLETESLELTAKPKNVGIYLCVICKQEHEALRVKGNPIRICKTCQENLDKNGQYYCTTCRTPYDKSFFMPTNKHRCRKCHYASMGVTANPTCLQCGKHGVMVKYSKVCIPCFESNEAKNLKFCVKCGKTVLKTLFPESGNVCNNCKRENINFHVNSETYHKLIDFLKSKKYSGPVNDINVLINILLKGNKNETK